MYSTSVASALPASMEEDRVQGGQPETVLPAAVVDYHCSQDRHPLTTEHESVTTAGHGRLSSALRPYQYVTSEFYKFLARFSGKSHPHDQLLTHSDDDDDVVDFPVLSQVVAIGTKPSPMRHVLLNMEFPRLHRDRRGSRLIKLLLSP